MINALIQNGDQTAVLKLPDDPFTLQYDLSQIGVRIRLRDIPIKDDEDSAIQVKLFADSDRKVFCTNLLTSDNLNSYLTDIDQQEKKFFTVGRTGDSV